MQYTTYQFDNVHVFLYMISTLTCIIMFNLYFHSREVRYGSPWARRLCWRTICTVCCGVLAAMSGKKRRYTSHYMMHGRGNTTGRLMFELYYLLFLMVVIPSGHFDIMVNYVLYYGVIYSKAVVIVVSFWLHPSLIFPLKWVWSHFASKISHWWVM